MDRKLTEPQRRAVRVLVGLCWPLGRAVQPGEFARAFWPDSPAWTKRVRGGALGGTMPMKGAKMLYTLEGLGLAYVHGRDREGPVMFSPTRSAKLLAEEG